MKPLDIHILIRILISMNATIHIRISDEDKWKAIPNKSEFIHKALNQPGFRPLKKDDKAVLSRPMVVEDFPKPIKTKQDAVRLVKEVFPDAKPIPPVTYKNTSNWGA